MSLPRPLRIAGRVAVVAAAVLALAVALIGAWLRWHMKASLAQLDGKSPLAGLGAPVEITRDALGVPTVTGSSRIDVARATGWIHAQERFFQMDLLRRRGAGELSELFGKEALAVDREARLHGFRQLASKALDLETPEHRAILQAYADGVNAGLSALRSVPWEYAVLRTSPRPWTAQDCLLVSFAMTLTLQEGTGHYVRTLDVMRSALGSPASRFLSPLTGPLDAALDGSVGEAPAIPPATELDVRHRGARESAGAPGRGPWSERATPGSNSFAVSAKQAGGSALVANDMHLHLGLPNIWYRMSLSWPGHHETGVFLPGTPALIAGSTGRVAWGFTNANVGTGDIILISPSASPELYHGPDGKLVRFENRTEEVAVRGSKPEIMQFRWTVWGPVVGEEPDGKLLVFHWVSDSPEATNFAIIDLEEASRVREAISIAHRTGITAQNFVVADTAGDIGWTVAGFLPNRVGYDGRMPATWAYGDRRWDGFLPDSKVPSVVSPAEGLIWTANNRTMGGEALRALGDAGYDIAYRASQIRADLQKLASGGRPITASDLLGVQLDDRALYLEFWHALMVSTLEASHPPEGSERARMLSVIRNWQGRASIDSASYRIVREFRLAAEHRVLDPIFEPCKDFDENFSWIRLNYEPAVLQILKERPMHLLEARYESWDALLLSAVDDVGTSLHRQGLKPEEATWGLANIARIEHPFARLVPRWLGGFLRARQDPLPGDSHMPRIQRPDFGASERFAVSPGHESEGYFEMPGGQSANPLSPYYLAGHDAWVEGNPTPFLPGPAVHTLVLSN